MPGKPVLTPFFFLFCARTVKVGSQGEYLKFPSLPLMFRNLHLRAKEVFSGLYLQDEESSRALGEAVRIQRYSLASAPFYIQKTPIIGYTGFIQLELPTENGLLRQAQALLELAPYTGIGVKTAIGMGGVEVHFGG